MSCFLNRSFVCFSGEVKQLFEIAASLTLLMHPISSRRQKSQSNGCQIRDQPGKDYLS